VSRVGSSWAGPRQSEPAGPGLTISRPHQRDPHAVMVHVAGELLDQPERVRVELTVQLFNCGGRVVARRPLDLHDMR
jgi:hypothetical protein